ncbi:hypothetical protein NS365_08480 [Aureimonas ureilytica]|uniref:Uncharacterized protein n=1 Tax=Aureimonas ureilytica TaxID=401562 RepID=A0A175RS18_9HYPH|nr:hypothetical protein NS365_08480 [Aureimonas ureilytica]
MVSVPLPPVPGTEPAPPAAPPATPPAEAPPAAAQPAPNSPPATERPPEAAPPAPAQAAPTAPASGPDAGKVADPDKAASAPPVSDVPPAEILYGEDKLPAPVRDLRRKLIEAAKTGEIEKLRPLLETGSEATAVSTSDDGQDPIEILKNASGDGQGVELLAILLETLQAGYVRLDPGGENELYMWPYFTQVNLEKLTKPQLVELFELVTAGDYERMVGNGSYDFYRVGISPEGRFEFFIAGD